MVPNIGALFFRFTVVWPRNFGRLPDILNRSKPSQNQRTDPNGYADNIKDSGLILFWIRIILLYLSLYVSFHCGRCLLLFQSDGSTGIHFTFDEIPARSESHTTEPGEKRFRKRVQRNDNKRYHVSLVGGFRSNSMLLTLLNQWESRKRKHSTMTNTTSSLPLLGARILIIVDEDERRYVELSTFINDMGGTVVLLPKRAEIALWSVQAQRPIVDPWASPQERQRQAQLQTLTVEQKRVLRECASRDVPVVETSWLELVSGLDEQDHWSDINVDSHVPAILALVGDGERNGVDAFDLTRTVSENPWRRDAQSKLGRSISETFANLTHENPDQLEEDAIRRAIELSMLDCALVYYNKKSSMGSFFTAEKHDKQPHEILGVSETASPSEIKSAYRKLARKHHPDKGGDSDVFEAIAKAYRTMLSLDVELERERPSGTKLKGSAHWDTELQDHRRLVDDLFQAHGSNLEASIVAQKTVLERLGLVAKDAGATNRNEKDELIRNSCFYLSLATSYLSGIAALVDEAEADRALIGETALRLKRMIEAAVVKAHPEWAASGMVGEEIQAFSDFLTYSLDGAALLSDWAVVIFDSSSGFCDIYKGCNYDKLAESDEASAQSNTITIFFMPGHYQPLLITVPLLNARPSLRTVLRELDAAGVFYVVTDGS